MTSNENTLINLRYTGRFNWGELEARAFGQDTRHEMNMGPDRFFYGFGMPMNAKAKYQRGAGQGKHRAFGTGRPQGGKRLPERTAWTTGGRRSDPVDRCAAMISGT